MTQDIDVGKLSEQLNDKADRDLWNTVPNVWNNTLNTSQITNCITEIPQDIKLELKDGVLTLKAGSKLYVPNGFEEDGVTKKFDVVVVSNDVQAVVPDSDRVGAFLTYNVQGLNDGTKHWSQWNVKDVFSGDVEPISNDNKIWYDTANNVIKECNDTVNWTTSQQTTFPFCRFSGTPTSVTSIDQVFNGFGYIGNSMFLLPDVKYLIPDGRDSKGNLQNIESKTNKVSVYNNVDFQNATWFLVIKENGIGISDNDLYDKISNTIIYDVKQNWAFCGKFAMDSAGKITSLTPKTTFEVLDKNDTSFLSSLGMPSDRKINLTWSATEADYTAPANGWFYARARSKGTAKTAYINLTNTSSGIQSYSSVYLPNTNAQYTVHAYVPVRKGQTIVLAYDLASTVDNNVIRFIYAEGEK